MFCRLDGYADNWHSADELDDDWLEEEDDDNDDDDEHAQERRELRGDDPQYDVGIFLAGNSRENSGDMPACSPRPLASPGGPSIWNRVNILAKPGAMSPEIDLFAVAACSGELIEDLKERSAERAWIDALNRHVGNLASTMRGGEPSLLGPVVTRFCECLEDVGSLHGDLLEKIGDLQSRLIGLLGGTEESE
jgi:hypothetical protein